jgi:FAD/FMN-containing dehydrogenase
MYEGLTGKIIVPGDLQYAQARQEWNEAINKFPCVIVYCFDWCDIANAILWSKRYGINLRIRSGGHNYEGYSIGSGVLVIDISCMNHVDVSCDDDTVKVQAGTKLIHLYETLYRYGYAFPGGTCPKVAISGLVLGGGIGLSTRYLGLTADSLIEINMVNAEGNYITANNCDNSDLFWGLQGAGGGNFGVVTSFKFQLKRKVNKITLIQLEWHNNKPARLEFFQVWQAWLKNLDCRISAFGGIYKRGAWVNSFFYGRPEEATPIIAPFLNIPGITLKKIEYIDFIDAVKNIGDEYPVEEAFKSTGRFMQGCLSADQLNTLIDIMDNAPTDANSYISVYSLGGAVQDKKEDDTAFFYRNADYIMGVSSSWEREKEARIHIEWVTAAFRYIYTISVGSYINFPYNELAHYQQEYFGQHIQQLQWIKNKYDPCNIFAFPQSIKKFGCGW